jgi:hypothetical protein
MLDELFEDPFFLQLCQNLTDSESVEIQQYLKEWTMGTYSSIAHSILDHATRKGIDPLKYLRKAHNFSKKGSPRIPRKGYRGDGSAVYRKGNEYLIVRTDEFGSEKIITYGVNDD